MMQYLISQNISLRSKLMIIILQALLNFILYLMLSCVVAFRKIDVTIFLVMSRCLAFLVCSYYFNFNMFPNLQLTAKFDEVQTKNDRLDQSLKQAQKTYECERHNSQAALKAHEEKLKEQEKNMRFVILFTNYQYKLIISLYRYLVLVTSYSIVM